MAVMKIKTIKSNLQAVINYAKNGDKTDNGVLVSSVNCSTQNCYEEMSLTKKFFHKEDKTLGYHIIQSFKGNEVSPERANQIGIKLAQELWGDKYQVIVCTHINKENIHNHLILNSVSFIDGKKYHNSKVDIAFMKEGSDNLCFKYGLSIVTAPRAEKEKEFRQKNIDNFNRRDEKMQKITTDIDDAIKSVKKYSEFKLVLKAKGYSNIKDNGKYFSLKTPYYSRNVRIDRAFGERYSVQGIKERIYYNVKEDIPVANLNKKYYKKIYTGPRINRFLLKTSSFYRLYVHYLYLLEVLPAKNEYIEITPAYYKQKRKNKMIIEEIDFLGRNNFKSVNEIENYIDNLEKQLPELKGKREILWRKHKTANETNKTDILKEIKEITEKIDTIQTQKNACIRIIARYEEMKEDYKKEIESKKKAQELIIADKKKKMRNR